MYGDVHLCTSDYPCMRKEYPCTEYLYVYDGYIRCSMRAKRLFGNTQKPRKVRKIRGKIRSKISYKNKKIRNTDRTKISYTLKKIRDKIRSENESRSLNS